MCQKAQRATPKLIISHCFSKTPEAGPQKLTFYQCFRCRVRQATKKVTFYHCFRCPRAPNTKLILYQCSNFATPPQPKLTLYQCFTLPLAPQAPRHPRPALEEPSASVLPEPPNFLDLRHFPRSPSELQLWTPPSTPHSPTLRFSRT